MASPIVPLEPSLLIKASLSLPHSQTGREGVSRNQIKGVCTGLYGRHAEEVLSRLLRRQTQKSPTVSSEAQLGLCAGLLL